MNLTQQKFVSGGLTINETQLNKELQEQNEIELQYEGG